MKRLSPASIPAWVIGLVLLLSLLVLALLQYRWLDRVRQADRQRRSVLLAEAGQRFAVDLDREISRAFLCFFPQERDAGDQVSARGLERWAATAADAALVSELLRLDREADGWSAQRMLPDEGVWHPVAVPAEVTRLLADWPALLNGPGAQRRPPWVLSEPLALLIPHRFGRRRAGSSTRRGGDPALPDEAGSDWETLPSRGFLLIRFDRRQLVEEILPALARRYFAGAGGRDYRVELFDAEGAQLFAAGPLPPATSVSRPDSLTLLFGLLPPDELRELAVQLRLWQPSDEGEPGGRRGRRMDELRRQLSPLLLTGVEPRPGRWRLAVTHSSGSLDHAVGAAMGRSLAIGLGTLAVLGLSMLLLYASARRQRRLARQQLEFVAGVTHELMTPLAAMRSAGQNLADGVAAEPGQVRRYGALIESEGRRLSGMVSQILEMAGVQSGRKGYDLRPLDLGAVARAALAASRPALEQAGFAVETEIAADLPPVSGDAEALQRAVENLIGNALKHASSAAWLGLTVEAAAGGTVELAVADHGPGVARADRARIFEPFVRGPKLAGSNVPGAGLGLSLVRQVVEAHGGTVRVESASPEAAPAAGRERAGWDAAGSERSGSRFVISLPAAGGVGEEGPA